MISFFRTTSSTLEMDDIIRRVRAAEQKKELLKTILPAHVAADRIKEAEELTRAESLLLCMADGPTTGSITGGHMGVMNTSTLTETLKAKIKLGGYEVTDCDLGGRCKYITELYYRKIN